MNDQNSLSSIYGREFFESLHFGTVRSARVVVPVVLDLVRNIHSVVDVGCGTGVWLSIFKEYGVVSVLGMDGGSAEDHGPLEIHPYEFRSVNLEQELRIDKRFDLCICLEVAEHLMGEVAPKLVRALCSLSDIVLFSAAIPGQGGTNHLNERWPSYWRDLFAEQGYTALDVVRGRIWHDVRVEFWYRQNMLLFANAAGLARVSQPVASASDHVSLTTAFDIVHPELFQHAQKELEAERAARLEVVKFLAESEADRAARLEQINILTDNLKQSEADRGARLEQINVLTDALKESEADRAARLEQIKILTDPLKESEADRSAHLKVIEG